MTQFGDLDQPRDRAGRYATTGSAAEVDEVLEPVDRYAPRMARALHVVTRDQAEAVEKQTRHLASFAGVRVAAAEDVVVALRDQYVREWAHLPEHERPTPPADWVRGFTRRDYTARRAPSDPATLYAFYRAQADISVWRDDDFEDVSYASIDLETASPPDEEFNSPPEKGHIIEVGVVIFDADGFEVDRYESLVDLPADAAARHGTGAEHVHGISLDMLQGAPSWGRVAGELDDVLAGKDLLAQNASFERAWLAEHMPRAGRQFDADSPGVDTLRIAQQHFSHLEHHRLRDICGEVGVPYTDGHRAGHDAEAAGKAFFAMRERIYTRYEADEVFRDLPRPRR